MTNLVLNAYSGIIEILLWVIVIGSGIAALGSLLVAEENAGVAVVGGIAGLLAGFLFCVLFLAPLILLSNMRDQLKEVSDNTSQISGDVKRIRLPR
ncbi:MAG: hypothetical protein HOF01_02830 [Chloroflexi bacterium]|jgi:hypothetical protein|nr:hypothetical protein [Chloroflexota bacterium]